MDRFRFKECCAFVVEGNVTVFICSSQASIDKTDCPKILLVAGTLVVISETITLASENADETLLMRT